MFQRTGKQVVTEADLAEDREATANWEQLQLTIAELNHLVTQNEVSNQALRDELATRTNQYQGDFPPLYIQPTPVFKRTGRPGRTARGTYDPRHARSFPPPTWASVVTAPWVPPPMDKQIKIDNQRLAVDLNNPLHIQSIEQFCATPELWRAQEPLLPESYNIINSIWQMLGGLRSRRYMRLIKILSAHMGQMEHQLGFTQEALLQATMETKQQHHEKRRLQEMITYDLVERNLFSLPKKYWEDIRKLGIWSNYRELKFREWLEHQVLLQLPSELHEQILATNTLELEAYQQLLYVHYDNFVPYHSFNYEDNEVVRYSSSYYIERGTTSSVCIHTDNIRQFQYFPTWIKEAIQGLSNVYRVLRFKITSLYPERGRRMIHPAYQAWEASTELPSDDSPFTSFSAETFQQHRDRIQRQKIEDLLRIQYGLRSRNEEYYCDGLRILYSDGLRLPHMRKYYKKPLDLSVMGPKTLQLWDEVSDARRHYYSPESSPEIDMEILMEIAAQED